MSLLAPLTAEHPGAAATPSVGPGAWEPRPFLLLDLLLSRHLPPPRAPGRP